MIEGLFLAGAFLFGSIPMGLVIGYLNGVDIRKNGSGNIGATNVIRCVGKKAGYLTFILDMLKGVFPLLLASYFFSYEGYTSSFDIVPFIGLLAIAGHCFSPFLKGRGGKGIATSFAVFLYLFPLGASIGILTFTIVFFITKYVSLGSLLAALVFIILAVTSMDSIEVKLVASLAFIIVLYKHLENITRLIGGTEHKFGIKKA